MKTSYILLAVLAASAATQAHAQIILGSYYDTATSQSVNTVADFTAAGVTGPNGATLSSADTVTGFNFSPAADTNAFGLDSSSSGGHDVPASFTSNGLTLTPGGNYFSSGSGVFQSSVFGSNGEVLSGLSGILQANTIYTLDLFSDPIFGGNQIVSFSYGSQSHSSSNVSVDGVVPFTFTTGSAVLDALDFNAVDGTTSSTGYPSLTGFAIVAEGAASTPEPSTYALMLAGLGALVLVAHLRRRKI